MDLSVNAAKIQDLINIDPSKDLLHKLIEIFHNDVKKSLAQIKADLENKKFSAISQLAHRMRTTSLNLGAISLGELFRQLEYTNYESTLMTEINAIIMQAEKAYERASEDLKKYL